MMWSLIKVRVIEIVLKILNKNTCRCCYQRRYWIYNKS